MTARRKEVLERRQYIRLDTVFPVQFQLVSLDAKQSFSGQLQGFTNNIGKGGLCLVINNIDAELAMPLKELKVKLSLNIELPMRAKSIPALARITWVKEEASYPDKYFIGLCYEQIDLKQNNMIMRYAWMKKLFVPLTLSVIILLGLGFLFNSFINVKLIKGNKALVAQLINIVQESSIAKQKIKEINKEKEDLQLRIQALQARIETLGEEKETKINTLVKELTQEKNSLQEQLIALQNKEGLITEELLRLDKKKSTLQKANLDKMYLWLKVHQNNRSGLVMSFEGDSQLEGFAFTYDQALVAQAYTYFSDYERARKILNFFSQKAQRQDNLFLNAYYVFDGKPAEYAVHSGPNIWLGIAILQYIKKTNDSQYLRLAEEIAQAIINLQKIDQEGAVVAGPNLDWVSTEHNLDAYAFFKMLQEITDKDIYQEARNRVLSWLVTHAYDRQDIPIKRGKGDSTIATDTYARSIASLGPAKLEELGMNPDRIMEFAQDNSSAKATEWTAQMVLAFKIMADFYYKKGLKAKAHAYEMKADEYMHELSNMIISSPTGSLSATTYAIFAYYNYNPLELKE
jgi:hypothetical protein